MISLNTTSMSFVKRADDWWWPIDAP